MPVEMERRDKEEIWVLKDNKDSKVQQAELDRLDLLEIQVILGQQELRVEKASR